MVVGLAIPAFAAAKTPATPAGCTKCTAMKALETRLNTYNYFDESQADDAFKDFEKVGTNYVQPFQNTYKKKAVDPQEFTELVLLIAAALPYDGESALADQLEGFISDRADLKAIYESTVPQVADSCRRQNLTDAVEEYACMRNAMKKGKWEKPGTKATDTCTKSPPFNFDDCLRAQGKGVKTGSNAKTPRAPSKKKDNPDGAGLSPCLLDGRCHGETAQSQARISGIESSRN